MTSALKAAAKLAIGGTAPWFPPIQALLNRSLLVFLYHDVSDEPALFSQECELAVSVRTFQYQLRFIAKTFNVVSMDDLLADRIPERAALITFDDGLGSVFRNALPILRRMGLPSTIFINMAPVMGEPFWAARAVYLSRHVAGFLEFLKERSGARALKAPHLACTPHLVEEWDRLRGDAYLEELAVYSGTFATLDDVKAAAEDPLVTFGNHLYQHYNMLMLSDGVLEAQVGVNAKALSAYRGYRPVLAFPFGRSFTERHVALLSAWGIERCFTGIPSANYDSQAQILHRMSLTSWHNQAVRVWFQVARAAVEGNLHRDCFRAGWGEERARDIPEHDLKLEATR